MKCLLKIETDNKIEYFLSEDSTSLEVVSSLFQICKYINSSISNCDSYSEMESFLSYAVTEQEILFEEITSDEYSMRLGSSDKDISSSILAYSEEELRIVSNILIMSERDVNTYLEEGDCIEIIEYFDGENLDIEYSDFCKACVDILKKEHYKWYNDEEDYWISLR